MSRRRSSAPRTFLVIAGVAAALASSRRVSAHPLGLSSVNRYLGVQCSSGVELHFAYVLDFAELPAYDEIEKLDADRDGSVTPAEQSSYLDRLLGPVVRAFRIEIDDKAIVPRVAASSLEAPPGQGGLSTLRIHVELTADRPSSSAADYRVRLHDTFLASRAGWREMGAFNSENGSVVASSVPLGLSPLAYGSDPLANVPRTDTAEFTCHEREGHSAPAPEISRSGPYLPPVDPRLLRLANTIRNAHGGVAFQIGALLLAFVLGAGHALTPGHGKVLVAAHLTGRRATATEAVSLGLTVTATHTVTVFLIAIFALWIERHVGSQRLFRMLEIGSGALIATIALAQLPRRWRQWLGGGSGADPGHRHEPGEQQHRRSSSSTLTLGVSGGLVPCPGALVVLLTAVAAHRIGFGLALVLTFSVGLAVVLVVIGVAVVHAHRWIPAAWAEGTMSRVVPVASSLCVLCFGLVVALSAWTNP